MSFRPAQPAQPAHTARIAPSVGGFFLSARSADPARVSREEYDRLLRAHGAQARQLKAIKDEMELLVDTIVSSTASVPASIRYFASAAFTGPGWASVYSSLLRELRGEGGQDVVLYSTDFPGWRFKTVSNLDQGPPARWLVTITRLPAFGTFFELTVRYDEVERPLGPRPVFTLHLEQTDADPSLERIAFEAVRTISDRL